MVRSPSSRLLALDMVMASPPDARGTFVDLHTQVLLGGRQRTEDEFRMLLGRAGM